MLDLASVPVVDVHCHPWRNDDLLERDPGGLEDRVTILGTCLVSSGFADERATRDLPLLTESTPLALTMRRRLAEHLGCEATREEVARARRRALAADPAAYNARLWETANVAGLVYDEGYPQPAIPRERFAADSRATVHRVGRIEPWIAELARRARSFRELEERFVARLDEEAADPGLVAFKSVIAYRTGLDVQSPAPDDYCEREFELWRASGFVESREHAKTVRDRLLHRTLEAARRHDRPLHIHCGGGDPAVVLGRARPQDLFPLLARHPSQPVVLIHSGWPWLEEGAYVASVLPQVYLDVSIMMPWASLATDQKLEVLLGVAPPAKVMHGSDEASEPEVIWLAAQLAREALGRVLATAVERAWLTEREARSIGEGVLAGNARRLHGLGG
ncbi:MAG: amidohydrolase family protein [Thermoleophilia bacterium]|nr:amidohydrolase family protein [Thermoleophilia bacterium]